ncbi:hypothetical protein FEM48_Zijuj07G0046000 [Ziziphus jujuba var. spinosa]|uniref:Uncharacterized protein n=1 Tax=Ziziphus jujuba var. spinosa TaxID=714518 RepID=A0A978V2H3_ZIZJJ|nr:hypothetical protein FEM48_Zijuj07G0046000 [Ziziphus jujuba var. spinosa]
MYHYYFHGYENIIKDNISNLSCSIELPGLPFKLTGSDFPSFMDASKPKNAIGIRVLKEQFKKQYGKGKKEEDGISCTKELEKLGKIVPWCSQMEVLLNFSLGCFVTHYGWNSTLESLVCSVPMVAFLRWIDQGSNAKFIENSWKMGLRVKANKEGIVERDEIKKLEAMLRNGRI